MTPSQNIHIGLALSLANSLICCCAALSHMDEPASTALRVRNGGWGFVNRSTRGRMEMAGEEGDDSAARKLSTATSILALT